MNQPLLKAGAQASPPVPMSGRPLSEAPVAETRGRGPDEGTFWEGGSC